VPEPGSKDNRANRAKSPRRLRPAVLRRGRSCACPLVDNRHLRVTGASVGEPLVGSRPRDGETGAHKGLPYDIFVDADRCVANEKEKIRPSSILAMPIQDNFGPEGASACQPLVSTWGIGLHLHRISLLGCGINE